MASVTPVWTDLVTVISDQAITRPNIVSATLDLRTKFGAYIFAKHGRVGTTALTVGVQFRVNRVPNNNGVPHPASLAPLGPGLTAATNGNTTVNTDSSSGQRVLQVAAVTNFVIGDFVIIGSGTARQEYARVARIDGGTVDLIMDRNLSFTHTAAQADTVRNKCDVYPPVWLPGGSVYEIIADYEASTTGDNNRVEVLAQTYDSNLLA
jgi:hypothetical protein